MAPPISHAFHETATRIPGKTAEIFRKSGFHPTPGRACGGNTPGFRAMSDFSNFADRLVERINRQGTPVLVGLDPRWEQLPPALTDGQADGVERRAAVYARFCRDVIDVVAPLVPAVKPQAAFFEQLGPPGMAALEEVIRHARARALLVILDGKRN